MLKNKSGFNELSFGEEDQGDGQLWLVTFADSMSLLLTFFVLLISFSSFENVSLTETMQSISEHLGGGEKVGYNQIRTNYNLSKEESELAKQILGLRLTDMPTPFQLDEKPIALDVNRFRKINALKELLKENPALLSILMQKKSLEQIKKDLKAKKQTESVENEIQPQFVSIELSLQNLQHYIVSEGLDGIISIDRQNNGEISFEIDCSALFDEGTDIMRYESKQLLVRIASMIKTIPNRIAIQHIFEQKFHDSDTFVEDWNIPISRAEKIIKYLLEKEPTISEDRFMMLARSYNDKDWETIQKVNLSGDGVIGITILAFSEEML